MKVALWGAGGHGGVVLDTVRQQGTYEPVAFIEDGSGAWEQRSRSGLPILCGREHLAQLRSDGVEGMVIAIGGEATRVALATIAVDAGFQLCTIVHPSAVICPDVRIGVGTVVFAGAVVQTGSQIGDNVVVNTCASIDHDHLVIMIALLAEDTAEAIGDESLHIVHGHDEADLGQNFLHQTGSRCRTTRAGTPKATV